MRPAAAVFDWIVLIVRTLGYPGIALLTFLENVVPPIPSELIMPFAGYLAAQGHFTLGGAIVAGTAGSIAGAVGWYYVGRRVGEARVRRFFRRRGRWVGLSGRDVDRAMAWFDRHGGRAVFVGRLIPAVRTLISLPAGFVAMPLLPFLLYSLAGTVAWTAILTYAGVALGRNYHLVESWLGPVTWIVIGAILASYAWKVITYDSADDEELSR